jgi:hypothetical protein
MKYRVHTAPLVEQSIFLVDVALLLFGAFPSRTDVDSPQVPCLGTTSRC